MSKKVVVYTATYCPYCERAKQLLMQKQIAFDEIDVTNDFEQREVLMKKSGGRKTIPQIFIGDTHVGGCDDLYALEHSGSLDILLKDD
ncbi:glutaredoxin 3 [Candidatus Nucleicultrix amoebiphila]|uniref:Glutaredoxin n=1 Tax=Candidatus Nucleicultrix amoebiphila FS5 TaxID=1414854 RepID=A0A1W6N5X5_9PROT|nr:glutaredoxin 3 [Candidatus Nucleicultrix amoebiphila]ARN85280.1 glutaredoxin [Candidatus Nucleicultrix amoebiphila FS5]